LLILPTSPMLKVDESTGIFSLSVASSIWRMTLGQIQKLMKKSTIGDPGMWSRCRTWVRRTDTTAAGP
jgi:hypothetical protein